MKWRKATAEDSQLLAEMNARLIEDERHRSRLTVSELADRMRSWLGSEYEAVLFEDEGATIAYALFKRRDGGIYLRQFFVERDRRRRRVGRSALDALVREVWPPGARITIDVLEHNEEARAFWRALGFRDYATMMELPARGPNRAPEESDANRRAGESAPVRSAHVGLVEALSKGPPPPGNLAVPIFEQGSLEVELYTPQGSVDPQEPHDRDEIYLVARGTSMFFDGVRRYPIEPGSFLFVAAGQPHRFEEFSRDFAVWVFFYGPHEPVHRG